MERQVWKLFFPLLISMALSSSIGILDIQLSGSLGPEYQACVGLGDQVLFLVLLLGTGLASALASVVSRCHGANDWGRARSYMKSGLILAFLTGTIASIGGYFAAEKLLSLLCPKDELSHLAVSYTSLCSLANLPFLILLFITAIFRALGQGQKVLILWLFTAGVSNCLSLVFFHCGVAWLKSLDALALAWIIAAYSGSTLALIQLKLLLERKQDSVPYPASVLNQKAAVFELQQNPMKVVAGLLELSKLGLPIVLAEASLLVSQFITYRVLAACGLGVEALAAWSIRLKLEETLALIPLLALGMSTSAVVGHKVGAGKALEARQICIKISSLAAFAMLALGLLISLFSAELAGLFCPDEQTRQSLDLILRPSALIFPMLALVSIPFAALEGAGKTLTPMICNLLSFVFIKSLLSYYFSVEIALKLSGIVYAILFSQLMLLPVSLSVLCDRRALTLHTLPSRPRLVGLHLRLQDLLCRPRPQGAERDLSHTRQGRIMTSP